MAADREDSPAVDVGDHSGIAIPSLPGSADLAGDIGQIQARALLVEEPCTRRKGLVRVGASWMGRCRFGDQAGRKQTSFDR